MHSEVTTLHHSVVVVGAMNPAIHHPSWYAAKELLSSSEVDEAERAGLTMIFPQLARFQVPAFELHCTPTKWFVKTRLLETKDRLINLAATTFACLAETPVSAYGINSEFEVVLQSQCITDALGNFLAGSPVSLTFKEMAPRFENLTVSYPLGDQHVEGQPTVVRQLNATLAKSPKRSEALIVTLNVDHKVATGQGGLRFDLDVLLRASTDAPEISNSFVRNIVAGLTAI